MIQFGRELGSLISRHARHLSWRIRRTLQREIVVDTPQGTYVTLPGDYAIGRALYEMDGYEYAESRRVLSHLKAHGFIPRDGVTMWDIGANIGVIGIGLALAGDVDRVVAIEPEPQNFGLLERNVQRNHLSDRFTCIQVAASDRSGSLTMHLSPVNKGDHRAWQSDTALGRHTVSVESRTLDSVAAELGVPHLLWMDIQGFEAHAMIGASGLLEKGIPLVTEVWPYGLGQAGTDAADFVRLVRAHWSDYWVNAKRNNRLVRFPVSTLDRYMDFIGQSPRDFENIVLTRET